MDRLLIPTVTCLFQSTHRPTFYTALASFQNQTRLHDVACLLITTEKVEPGGNVEVWLTGERENLRERYAPTSRVVNAAYRNKLIRGEYFCMHYDDDIYYPTFMEKMAGYLDERPSVMAVRCTQNRTLLYANSTSETTPPLVANRIMTPEDNYDCVVDGMQVMMRTEVLDKVYAKYGELMPEDPDHNSASRTDGQFFDRCKEFIPEMHFIEEALCEHRATPNSTYTPTEKE